MCRRGICCLVMMSLTWALASTAQAETIEDVKKAISEKMKAYKTLQYKMKSNNNMEMQGMSMKSESDMTFEYERKDEKTILMRSEMKTKSTQVMGDQKVTTDSNVVSVSDGKFVWTLTDSAGQKMVTKNKAPEQQADMVDFKAMEEMWNMKLLPDATVDGKPCHVLEMTPKQEMMKQAMGKMVQYYDKKTALGVKTITYDGNGKENGQMIVTDIKVDEKISPDRFTFKAPPGVQVIDQTQTPAADQ